MSKAESKTKQDIKLRRDFSAVVLDLYGHPHQLGRGLETFNAVLARFTTEADAEASKLLLKILEEEGMKTMTLGMACAEALAGAYKGEEGMGFDERERRYTLARRLIKGGVQEITPSERDKIRGLLTQRFGGSVTPSVCAEMLETEVQEEASE